VSSAHLASSQRRFGLARVPVFVALVLSRYEWLFLLVVAPLLFFPSPARTPALLAIPALWISRRVALGHLIPRTPLDTPLVLMTLMVLVSLVATFDISFSLPKITGMVLGLAVYYAVVEAAADRRSWVLALGGFMLAGVGVTAMGLLGTRWNPKFAIFAPILRWLPPRITGLPGAAEGFHPNEVAGALLWVAPVACALATVAVLGARSIARSLGRVRGAILLVVMVTTAAFLVGVLMLTQSRGGWIAAALVLPVLLLVLIQGKLRRAATLLLAGSVVTAAVWIALAGPSALDPLIIGSQQDPSPGMSLETLSGRVEVWSRAIYGIQDFAFTGMGMNAFRRVVPVLYPLFSIDPTMDIGHAHNAFLQAALDLGIPGLIAYLAVHISAFAMLISTWRRRGRLPFPEPLSRALILGLGGGLASHLIYSLTDAVALGAKPGVLWWMLLGLVASLYRGPALRKVARPKPEDRCASLLRAPR
jgi:putative inorganic carbon (HCO3(-)) transporter